MLLGVSEGAQREFAVWAKDVVATIKLAASVDSSTMNLTTCLL
jgi:hypothetical protein